MSVGEPQTGSTTLLPTAEQVWARVQKKEKKQKQAAAASSDDEDQEDKLYAGQREPLFQRLAEELGKSTTEPTTVRWTAGKIVPRLRSEVERHLLGRGFASVTFAEEARRSARVDDPWSAVTLVVDTVTTITICAKPRASDSAAGAVPFSSPSSSAAERDTPTAYLSRLPLARHLKIYRS